MRTVGIVQGISYVDEKTGEPVSVVSPTGIVFSLVDPLTGAPMLCNLTARPGGQAVFTNARPLQIDQDKLAAARTAGATPASATTPLPPGTEEMVADVSSRPTPDVRPGKPSRRAKPAPQPAAS